ncbi:hypothetical protein QOZ80_5BG0438810 [Eleusine coracana subsp. coracana]|nr:hypothetical protein QOZ80_5BG0438810 [Eleusine coracana subsp. coracana]
MAAHVTDLDLISDLHDNLLLRILAFLPAAAEVARTSALSKRWCHLWTLAVALRFNVGSIDPTSSDDAANTQNASKLIAVADAALARRAAAGPDLEDLEMRFVYTSEDDPDGRYGCGEHQDLGITLARVATWIHFAARHVTGQFTLAIPSWKYTALPSRQILALGHWAVKLANAINRCPSRSIFFAELPSSGRFQAMTLALGDAILTIPAAGAGAFHTLTDVVLVHAQIDTGNGGRLGQLFSSSCCPRLRRLHLKFIDMLETFDLNAASTLEELRLECLIHLRFINVDAPALRELRIEGCSSFDSTRISAPRLEVLASEDFGPKESLSFDGVASIRRLERLDICSHQRRRELDEVHDNDGGIETSASMWLLQQCTGVNWLAVDVMLPSSTVKKHGALEYVYKDMIIDMPLFPNVRNLTIGVFNTNSQHSTGATLVKFITKCPRIECITIDTWPRDRECSEMNCICNEPKGWEDQEISLERLRKVEIFELLPFKSEISFVRLLLARSPALERMTVSLDSDFIKRRHEETGKDVDFEIPCYGGRWEPCAWECRKPGFSGDTKYEWTPRRKEGPWA